MNNGTILDKDSYMSLDTMVATWALGSISSNLGSHYLMIEIKKCEFFKNLDWPTTVPVEKMSTGMSSTNVLIVLLFILISPIF